MQHVRDQAALLCTVGRYSVLSLLWQQPVLLGTVGGLACTDQSRSNSGVNQGSTLDTYIKTRQPAALRPPMGSCWMLDRKGLSCLHLSVFTTRGYGVVEARGHHGSGLGCLVDDTAAWHEYMVSGEVLGWPVPPPWFEPRSLEGLQMLVVRDVTVGHVINVITSSPAPRHASPHSTLCWRMGSSSLS